MTKAARVEMSDHFEGDDEEEAAESYADLHINSLIAFVLAYVMNQNKRVPP